MKFTVIEKWLFIENQFAELWEMQKIKLNKVEIKIEDIWNLHGYNIIDIFILLLIYLINLEQY